MWRSTCTSAWVAQLRFLATHRTVTRSTRRDFYGEFVASGKRLVAPRYVDLQRCSGLGGRWGLSMAQRHASSYHLQRQWVQQRQVGCDDYRGSAISRRNAGAIVARTTTILETAAEAGIKGKMTSLTKVVHKTRVANATSVARLCWKTTGRRLH